MKRLILVFLFLVVTLTFAQNEERTFDGYRIIRIEKEQTKVYKDSIAEQKKIPIAFKFSWGMLSSIGYKTIQGYVESFSSYYYAYDDSTAFFQGVPFQLGLSVLIPLMPYYLALRTGILYESTYLFCKRDLIFDSPQELEIPSKERGRILRGRIAFPLVMALKTRTSPLMFEFGSQIAIPVMDKYRSSDLIDRKMRSSVDVAILFGGNVIVNKYISWDLLWEVQLNNAYKDDFLFAVSGLRDFSIKLGVIFTPF